MIRLKQIPEVEEQVIPDGLDSETSGYVKGALNSNFIMNPPSQDVTDDDDDDNDEPDIGAGTYIM